MLQAVEEAMFCAQFILVLGYFNIALSERHLWQLA